MNREIKFRGYSEYYKKWLYGSLVNNLFIKRKTKESCSYIFDTSLNEDYNCWEDFIQDEEIEVITESVGQYTGLKDKNGVEIYEYMEIDDNFEVSFKDGCYILTNISNGDIILLYNYLRDKNGQVTVTKEYTKI